MINTNDINYEFFLIFFALYLKPHSIDRLNRLVEAHIVQN